MLTQGGQRQEHETCGDRYDVEFSGELWQFENKIIQQ